jgi:hypothetical protein
MISGFSIDSLSGALTAVPGSPYFVGGVVQSVAVHPAGGLVYAVSSDSGDISVFTVNPQDGSLTQIPQSPFSSAPGAGIVSFDPTGRCLFVGTDTGLLFAFRVNAMTGVLKPFRGSPYPGGNRAAVHPSGLFLYTGGPSQGIAYSISLSGSLTPISGVQFSVGSGLVVDGTGRFLYATVGSPANAVYGYSINTSGALSAMPNSPFAAGPGAGWTALDPTGQYLYVVNTDASAANISGYAVDPVAGGLTQMSGSPFPNGFGPQGITTVTQNEGLTFPVKYDPTFCKGGMCTPTTVNVSAVFDHQQKYPYEQDGVIEAYTGEIGMCNSGNPNQQYRGRVGSTKYWGYGQASGLQCFVNSNYTGGGGQSNEAKCGTNTTVGKAASNLFLFYDGHPGYDYPFAFNSTTLTSVFPAISGCITYKLDAGGGATVNQANYHVLTIIPFSAPPTNGCSNITGSQTGYVVSYLHLASYVGADGTTMMVCPAPPNSRGGTTTTCPNEQKCDSCPLEGTWVSVSTQQPIAYVGNFAYDSKAKTGAWGVVGPHLHLEVDQMLSLTAKPLPIDPYGWQSGSDPYSALHNNVVNKWLWRGYNSDTF